MLYWRIVMSKKNLSRTIIEGGRTKRSKYYRENCIGSERTAVRTIISGSHGDSDFFDDVVIPKRDKSSKDFYDRLSSVERYLDSRVGKSWNKTFSYLKENFDIRTTAGRHLIYDHVLNDIAFSKEKHSLYDKIARYYVDKSGILRKNPKSKYNPEERAKKEKEIREWLSGRMIGKVGNVLYWYNATTKIGSLVFNFYYGRYESEAWLFPRFIQGERLKGKDIEFFTKLDPFYKDALLKNSKILTRCVCVHPIQHHVGGMCQIPDCKCNIKWV